jgi:hypothetical protein
MCFPNQDSIVICIVPWLYILTNQISPYEVDKSLIKPCIKVQGLITTSGHTSTLHTSRTILLLRVLLNSTTRTVRLKDIKVGG